MRKKIYEIIEVAEDDNQLSRLYDVIMLFFILLSIIPLTFKETNRLLYAIDKITVSVFTGTCIYLLIHLCMKNYHESLILNPFHHWTLRSTVQERFWITLRTNTDFINHTLNDRTELSY